MENHKLWINAYKQVLQEYQDKTHICDYDSCSKCEIAKCIIIGNGCDYCPENIFTKGPTKTIGCVDRPNSKPISFNP